MFRLIIAIGSVQDKPWNEEIYQRLLTFKFLAGPMPMRPEEVQPQRRILGKCDGDRVKSIILISHIPQYMILINTGLLLPSPFGVRLNTSRSAGTACSPSSRMRLRRPQNSGKLPSLLKKMFPCGFAICICLPREPRKAQHR